MSVPTISSSYLLTQFREFYSLVVRLKTEAQYKSGSATTEREIWQQIVTLLERQAREAENFGRASLRHYEEAQYVMAALGDEIFVHLEWPGKEAWKSNLLEAKLFGTHVAGERLYERLDRLLQVRDPNQIDLAAVYLLALALGFQGKYAVVEDDGKLAQYRIQLYSFIAGREPAIGASGRRLLTDLPLQTLEEPTARRLPDPRRWYYAVAAALLVLVLTAHVFWSIDTAELRTAVEAVLRWR